MRKELIVYVETNEEETEADIRLGHETNTVVIGYEGMRFVVDIDNILEAINVVKDFNNGLDTNTE